MTIPSRLLALGGCAVVAGVSTLGMAPAAFAAPGDPFDPAKPTVFIGQGDPTQLQVAEPDENGNFTFGTEGGPSSVRYNGLGFSTEDNYLYGFAVLAADGFPIGSLIQIGEGGTTTRVGTEVWDIDGTSFNVGAIDPVSGNMYATVHTDDEMYVIDPATGTQVGSPIALTGSMASFDDVSDWTFSGGFLWGLGANRTMVRVNPANGTVNEWTLGDARVDTGFSGAAWTYADDTMGFSHNATGQVERIAVTNPASANPTFTVVRVSTGPTTTNNDGAASPGLPADLSLTKTSAGFAPGGVVTYTLTVTNEGEGFSTGWTLEDSVPAELTDVTAGSDVAGVSCTVTGNDVTCTGGELAPDDSVELTVTAGVPAGLEGTVRNSAEVTGNEEDPNLDNNTAAVADEAPGEPVVDDEVDEDDVPADPSVPAGGESTGTGTGTTAAWVGGGLALLACSGLVVAARRRALNG